mgnify:CR=1 FL=1
MRRADQIAHMEGDKSTYWMAPIIAEMLKFAIRRYPVGSDLEDKLDSMIEEVDLDHAAEKAQALMAGQVRGRVVVRI